MRKKLSDNARSTVDRFLRLYDAVEAELEALDVVLRTLAHHDARVRLLMTLPGVAHMVALTLIAALGDITRFRDGDHAAICLGLTPIVRQSAGKCYRGSITKAGSSTSRAILTQEAQHAANHPGPLGAFFPQSEKPKPRNVAIIATASKLATIAFLMLKSYEPYRYAQPERVRAKLRHAERAAEESSSKGSRSKAKVKNGPVNRLNRTYARVCLATAKSPEEWSEGEQRFLEEAGVTAFAEPVDAPLPKRGPRPTTWSVIELAVAPADAA